jgi:glycosyltransferase involved in cell wall biosynthesis
MNPKISIAIPCYEISGLGAKILEYSFFKLENQTFRDFDIIISDNSLDNEIKKLCKKWNLTSGLDIKYYKNKIRGAAVNTDSAIKKADGEFVKVLCQDDLLFDEHSLEIINNNLDENTIWLFSAYVHSYDRLNCFKYHLPSINPWIAIQNTLGTPSALTIKNLKDLPELDNNLTYCYDCAWYYELNKLYGNPKIIEDITMINVLWEKSLSSNVTNELINKENNYIINKYGLK